MSAEDERGFLGPEPDSEADLEWHIQRNIRPFFVLYDRDPSATAADLRSLVLLSLREKAAVMICACDQVRAMHKTIEALEAQLREAQRRQNSDELHAAQNQQRDGGDSGEQHDKPPGRSEPGEGA